MKFVTRAIFLAAIFAGGSSQAEPLRESVLREAALKHGLRPVDELLPAVDPEKAAVGELLFESELLSLTKNVACRNCHLDEFGSADGLPLGHGAGGVGSGLERMRSEAGVLPRNTLPLWGRGAIGFDTFFWDGRVDGSGKNLVSSFGMIAPSDDPLTVVAHLPPVEFREMIGEGAETEGLRQGTIDAAEVVYSTITERVLGTPVLAVPLATAFELSEGELSFLSIAESLAAFIRTEFQLRETRFHRFVFSGETLSDKELAGGLLFYGRGMCASCHDGPFFSDMVFHSVPFDQFGFGPNGFGIDYGRYNVTLDPSDLYSFRTPPLFNVTKTAPYGHSGSEPELADAIRKHVDPLWETDMRTLTPLERSEIYRRLARWSQEPGYGVELDASEIDALVAFLSTLDFEPVEE
jgi:cytochrome c peroxidase